MMFKSLALVGASLCVASVNASFYLWNGPSASNKAAELWIGKDGSVASTNPYSDDVGTSLKSTSFGAAKKDASITLSDSGSFGMKIVFNGKTKLVLGDGSGKTTIKLAGSSSGEEIVFAPFSGKQATNADGGRNTKYDVNCHTNWIMVDNKASSPDEYKIPSSTGGAFCNNDNKAIFDPSQPVYAADMSETKRPSGSRLFAMTNRNNQDDFSRAVFNWIYVGENQNNAKCEAAGEMLSFDAEGIDLDFGECDKDVGVGSKTQVKCRGTAPFASSCPAAATISVDGKDKDLVKIGDDYKLVDVESGLVDPADITPTFDTGAGTEPVDPKDATHVGLTVGGVEYNGKVDEPIVAVTYTSSTVTTVAEENNDGKDGKDDNDEGNDEENDEKSNPDKSKTENTNTSGNSNTGVIVAVIIVLLLVIVGAVVYVKKNAGGGASSAAAGGVVSFENPMYDDAKGMGNPTYAQSGGGAQGQAGYMDVPAGGGGGGGQSGYMDVNPQPAQGGGAGYMDVSPNAGGGFAESGYMDVAGGAGGGYMDGSDGEEDV